jgi:hypothetical protein
MLEEQQEVSVCTLCGVVWLATRLEIDCEQLRNLEPFLQRGRGFISFAFQMGTQDYNSMEVVMG